MIRGLFSLVDNARQVIFSVYLRTVLSSLVYTPHKQRGITPIDFGSDSVWCVLQNMSGWNEYPLHKTKSFLKKTFCVACCVSCVSRCWLSSGVSYGAWRGLEGDMRAEGWLNLLGLALWCLRGEISERTQLLLAGERALRYRARSFHQNWMMNVTHSAVSSYLYTTLAKEVSRRTALRRQWRVRSAFLRR